MSVKDHKSYLQTHWANVRDQLLKGAYEPQPVLRFRPKLIRLRVKRWVVDMDLAKFFDEVHHDILMNRIARRVYDKRALRLIRKYMQAGIMIGGLVTQPVKGTPQGGPLSPLLSSVPYESGVPKETH